MNQHSPDTERRIDNLEIKIGFMEDLVEELNRIVARQQEHIDLLLREAAVLRHQLGENTPGTFRSLREELPPHY
jgi:SlyX protein